MIQQHKKLEIIMLSKKKKSGKKEYILYKILQIANLQYPWLFGLRIREESIKRQQKNLWVKNWLIILIMVIISWVYIYIYMSIHQFVHLNMFNLCKLYIKPVKNVGKNGLEIVDLFIKFYYILISWFMFFVFFLHTYFLSLF